MKWGLDNGDFDSEFTIHINERRKIRNKRPPQPSVRVSEQSSPLDTGLMPSDLSDFLLKKAGKGPNVQAFSQGRIKALPLYNEFYELMGIRNKVMHGLPSTESSRQIAHRIASVCDAVAIILGDNIGNISKPGVNSRKPDHTTWARLLFLTEDELLWIAGRNQMPTGGSYEQVISLPIGNRGTDLTDFRKTDRTHGSKTIPLGTAADLSNFESVWVSTTHFKLNDLAKTQGEIRQLAPTILGLPRFSPRNLYVGELCEGLDNVESDPFSIPWWRKAPEGSAYICIAL